MFSRKFRLPARAKLLFAKTIHTPLFTLKVSKNGLLYNRYAFIVSKKIDKRATVRNRVRRVVRSCFEELHEKLEPGNDFLAILKKEASGKEREEILEIVKEYLEVNHLITQYANTTNNPINTTNAK